MGEKGQLPAKQQVFVDAITNGSNKETYNNIKRSYMAAYPKSSEKAAESNGVRLIRKDKIDQAITAIIAKRQAKIEYNYEQAVIELNEQIANLRPLALTRNIQAVQAITALLREKNDITGLHKQNIHRTGDIPIPVMDEDEAKALRDIARQYKIKLAGTG